MYQTCLRFVGIAEGGANFNIVNGKPVLKPNSRNDRGGPTKYGITWGTLAKAYSQGLVNHNDITRLTKPEADAIYEAMYWRPSRSDKLPWGLCLVHFDCAVNSGVSGAGKLLQRSVNDLLTARKITVDGIIGPDSLLAVGEVPLDALTARYLDVREMFYRGLVAKDPGQGTFLPGWLNRLKRLRREIAARTEVAAV
jgi:lysozyme family protein